jgi:hypothetical protein
VFDRSSTHYRSALEEILRVYENQGFIVARIHADHEFKSTVEVLQTDGKIVSFNLSNSQEYQPHAERNNRTIQEREKAVVHCLPYHAVPNNVRPLSYSLLENFTKAQWSFGKMFKRLHIKKDLKSPVSGSHPL